MNATNKILLRRKNLLIVEPINADYEQTKNEQALVVTMMKMCSLLASLSPRNCSRHFPI